ncbi:acyl-CoA dehydrogenase family protein [Conexibacter sp. SYSU D00693]|uniref:acyl-CoA dehydrogenase family protein n=1 Tax=Conexibacter sp. SYSU D00693 TaxID=2812560 RepID=UPI00196AE96E|nr:acyl-CoA dehydrogenase family protein [Conexibacter sp. SYSU D00693]
MSVAERPSAATHEVTNQPPPLAPLNLFTSDRVLQEAAEREGAGWARQALVEAGESWGGEPLLEWGPQANENPPRLKVVDRYGHRLDEVEFHPSWHELMRLSSEGGLNSLPWTETERPAHVVRAAGAIMTGQVEAGHGCPMTMTFAVVPALRAQSEIAAEWEPLLTAPAYDGRLIPASEKGSAKAGMAMTEKQGGSDVRANTTVAEPVDGGGAGGEYLLRGHKWFCSAPMCDMFLVLAQTEDHPTRPSCFHVPRILPDGSRNVFRIQRLKEKLGDRSNASSEVEFDGTWGRMVGEPGRGVPTIIEMVGHTRLDCIIGSAAGMRWAVANATWHTAHRAAFGKLLAEQPLMRNVLADIAIESEAATALALRLARAYDEDDVALRRLGTAVGKYWVCKRLPGLAAEAMECLGGNGFVEESGMPRLFRQSPLNSIWEGSGNVNALDVLRALAKQPEVLAAYFDELELAGGADARLDAFIAGVRDEFADLDGVEVRARRIVEKLALAWQGSLLVRGAPAEVADAFCASRLAGDAGLAYGTLPRGLDLAAIVERATPVAA